MADEEAKDNDTDEAEAEKAIHRHAFWLYGVIVGIAIKEALGTTVSHFIEPERLGAELRLIGLTIRYPHTEVSLYPEAIRLTVFLALIIRFYFGSAFFFGAAYESKSARVDYPASNYGIDFVFGFFHFVSFGVLALMIDIHTAPIWWFPTLVGFVLIYDLFWYVTSIGQHTREMIFWWMIINVINASISAALYLGLRGAYGPLDAEICAFWIVIAVSVVDIGLMMAKKPFFQPLIDIAPRRRPKPPTSTPPPA